MVKLPSGLAIKHCFTHKAIIFQMNKWHGYGMDADGITPVSRPKTPPTSPKGDGDATECIDPASATFYETKWDDEDFTTPNRNSTGWPELPPINFGDRGVFCWQGDPTSTEFCDYLGCEDCDLRGRWSSLMDSDFPNTSL